MRVLVTGARGFIGEYVCAELMRRGHAVLAFDRRNAGLNFSTSLGDVRDAEAVAGAAAHADAVIHLAGVLGTQETIDYPEEAIATNIGGSLNVFRACQRYSLPCVYITVANHWMENPYSITKTTAERFARMYVKEKGVWIAVVRAYNAYGAGQKAWPVRKIIPSFMRQALRGLPLEIYGDGQQVMDMIHVRDVARILVDSLGQSTADSTIEAGSGEATTVYEIARLVNELTGNQAGVQFLPMRPGEPKGAVVLASKLKEGEARVPLRVGLLDTIVWYKQKEGYRCGGL
jgi:UDP-glucose 4-epimerase